MQVSPIANISEKTVAQMSLAGRKLAAIGID